MIFIFLIILLFSANADANTYWVRPTGTMSGCTQSASAPVADSGYKSTIAAGIGCLAAGDTLFVRAGTYNETFGTTPPYLTLPNGIDDAHHTTLSGYLNERPTIKPLSNAPGGIMGNGNGAAYLTYTKFQLDCTTVSNGAPCTGSDDTHHIVWDDIDVFNLRSCLNSSGGDIGSALLVGGDSHVIRNSRIHDNGVIAAGTGPCHNSGYGIYMSASNSIIDNNDIYNNGGNGIQLNHQGAGPDNDIVRNNRLHDNNLYSDQEYAGITAEGRNHKIYNNVLWHHTAPHTDSISVTCNTSACVAHQVYNNTIVDTTGYGINQQYSQVSTIVRNNIVVNSGMGNLVNSTTPNMTQSNNLCYQGATNATCTYNGDPLFVNRGANDFTITNLASPANNNGMDLSSVFTSDILGQPRVLPWDIGAYAIGVSALLPTVSISLPANCIGTTSACTISGPSSSVTLTGAATNSVTISWANDSIRNPASGGSIAPSLTWTTKTNEIPLLAGKNNLTVTATNVSGSVPATIEITYVPSYPGPTLAAAYPFNEGSGQALDTSGNSNNASLFNGATRAAGKFYTPGALSLNGLASPNGSFASANGSASLAMTQSLTVTAWVNPSATRTDFRVIVAKLATALGSSQWQLFATTDSILCPSTGAGSVAAYVKVNGASGPTYAACAPPLQINQLTFVAMSYDQITGLKLYINGGAPVVNASASGYIEPSLDDLRIGNSNFGEEFGGLISELRIYNTALPLSGKLNTTPNAICDVNQRAEQAAIGTASIIGAMNCSIVSPVPPLPNKWPASATALKVGAGAGILRWAAQ